MNKYKHSIVTGLWILFTYLTVSCGHKKDALPLNVIPVAGTVGNYSILNLSDYATEIKYIPLETNDSVLVGRISQISYENEKILTGHVTHSGIYYLFDKNGKFCCQIGQSGQGPGDYLLAGQTFMHENLIYINDPRKTLIFDTTGYLVERINLWSNDIPAEYGELGARVLPLKKDTFVLDPVTVMGYYPKAVLLEAHPSGAKMIKEYPAYVPLDKIRPGILGIERGIMYRFKDELRTYKVMNDTVFTIDQNTDLKEAFIFEFGKFKPAISLLERKEENSNGSISGVLEKHIYPLSIFESSNHLFIGFSFGNHSPEPVESTSRQGQQYVQTYVYGVFDKHTGELALMHQPVKGKLGFKNDIDNGPVIWPQYISSSNELVTHISAEEFLDYYKKTENPTSQMTETAECISWDDNPVVIIAKLK